MSNRRILSAEEIKQKKPISQGDMRRHEWIMYTWECVGIKGSDIENYYLRSGVRDISEALDAAMQFDEARAARLANIRFHE